MPVLELDERDGVAIRDGVPWREAPLPVVRDAGAEEFAAAVGDDRCIGRTFEKVLRQAAEPTCQKDLKKNQKNRFPPGHRVTAAVADAVLAATCGSYIAEQVMAGRVYVPS